MKQVTYPEGTKFGDYFLTKDTGSLVIKRNVTYPNGNRTLVRLSQKQFNKNASKETLESLVVRLNGRQNRKSIEAIKTKLAFLPVELLEEFKELLESEIPNQVDARNHYRNLHRYFLKFFVESLNLKDPLEWKANEHKWGMALLHQGQYRIFNKPMSVKMIKKVIQVSNRFMSFLHRKNPKEISFIKFEPISKARLKNYQAEIEMTQTEEIGLYVKDSDWVKIVDKIPANLAPFVKLGYYYGLRRAETLGFSLEDIANGHLNVVRQIDSINKFGSKYSPLKGRSKRKTPHWFITPKETYYLLQDSMKYKMHPDTLGTKFSEFLKNINLSKYSLHDLRRTFITRALDFHSPKEVMLAVGHKNIEVTMKYLRDDRELSNSVYRPD